MKKVWFVVCETFDETETGCKYVDDYKISIASTEEKAREFANNYMKHYEYYEWFEGEDSFHFEAEYSYEPGVVAEITIEEREVDEERIPEKERGRNQPVVKNAEQRKRKHEECKLEKEKANKRLKNYFEKQK